MADTVRTLAALQSLLADNETGDISPQDLRDMLVSILGAYGGFYIHASSTGHTLGGSEELCTLATPTAFDAQDLEVDTGNKKVTIATDGKYLVLVGAVCRVDSTNAVTLKIRKTASGGSSSDIGIASHYSPTQADETLSFAMAGIADLVDGDYLRLWVNGTATDVLTVTELSLVVCRLA